VARNVQAPLGAGGQSYTTITAKIFDICVYFILHKQIYDRKTESLPEEHYNFFFFIFTIILLFV
jgi:hypothetical protein